MIVTTFIIALILGAALFSTLGPDTETVTGTLATTSRQAAATTTEETVATSIAAASWDYVWEYKADYVIRGVSISSDGNYIAAIGDNYDAWRNDVLYLFTKDGTMLWRKDAKELLGSHNWIHDVSVSRNATRIVVGSEHSIYLVRGNGTIVWERSYRDYDYLEGENFVSISNDGEYIAGGTYPLGQGWVYCFDAKGEEMWKFRTLGDVSSVSMSMDARYIVAGDDRSYVYLFDRQGNLLWDKKLEDRSPYDSIYVSISYDGHLIAVGLEHFRGEDRLGILNNDGSWVLEPIKVDHALGMGISVAGAYIFVAGGTSGLCVYDMKGALTASFMARESVNDVSVTPDATSVVVGSSDMRVYFLRPWQ